MRPERLSGGTSRSSPLLRPFQRRCHTSKVLKIQAISNWLALPRGFQPAKSRKYYAVTRSTNPKPCVGITRLPLKLLKGSRLRSTPTPTINLRATSATGSVATQGTIRSPGANHPFLTPIHSGRDPNQPLFIRHSKCRRRRTPGRRAGPGGSLSEHRRSNRIRLSHPATSRRSCGASDA